MTAGGEFSGEPETTFQFPGIHQPLNFQPFYSFSISPSSITDDSSMNVYTNQPETHTAPSPDEWDQPDSGGWNDWDQEFDSSLPNSTLGRFNISLEEGTVSVDVDGGESFNDDGFFRFQELVSVMEGLVPEDRQRDSKTVMEFLKSRRYEKRVPEDDEDWCEEICAICHGEFEDEEIVATLQNCKHEFHGDCITQWLIRKNACPLCNQDGLKLP
ncbi:OLC1v1023836C1 [Oldenlandia corymbosa var. corymbosa]|uniref:RING-type E3 ubiquitin transferase n=1 Tax=Oldenlandia corymbosa var. corymbosa TaxID=529605 RepID=A0AAV1C1D8_OLDCO|nr:OLC1v1023836C1 [Oldenlandia corymbosa var. corymbosa]